MLNNVINDTALSMSSASLICLGASLVLGVVIALVYMRNNTYSKSFVVTLALLPAIVQTVIMLVNGNLGVGVAVMGTFSLVRFRSIPGSASEILAVFFAMAVGLATGMGFVLYAAAFTLIISVVMFLYNYSGFGEGNGLRRTLKVVIPEDLDYAGIFDDLFAQYTKKATLERVHSTNLGSLFELRYTITLRDAAKEKELLDKIRERNGNLNITCGRVAAGKEEL